MSSFPRFYRRLSALLQLFWIAVTADALYILAFTLAFTKAPGVVMSQGLTLSIVPDMTEYVLMSAVLLLLGGIAAQLLAHYCQ